MINRAYKYRIYAEPEVESFFARCCGVVRMVYNIALEQRTNHWRAFRRSEGRNISYPSQARELTAIRVGPAEILNSKWARVRLPKIGDVKFRLTRPIRGEIGNVTVTREANGWHVVFATSFEHDVPANASPAVGIDRGVVNNVALSTGELFHMPDGSALEECHRAWQRTASRRKSRSKRQAKARRRLHWQHEVTSRLARRFGTAVLEDLRVRNMSASAKGTAEEPGTNVRQKAGLNRSILGAAWYRFETLLTYKLEFLGGNVVKIDPRHTSVTCPKCGSKDRENRENQAKFSCLSCGHQDHADVNAAVNILRAGTRPSVAATQVRRSREPKRAA